LLFLQQLCFTGVLEPKRETYEMVCIECYLPFIAVVLHFLFPYVAAIVERLTGYKLQAPKPAVCPLPQGQKTKKVDVINNTTNESSSSATTTTTSSTTKMKASTTDACCSDGAPTASSTPSHQNSATTTTE
jgi:hypothetical protein